MKIISERSYEIVFSYRHVFSFDRAYWSGFDFDLDSNYKPILLNDYSRKNYEACKSGMVNGKAIHDMGTFTISRDVFTPAVGECECGHRLALANFTNTCSCGADYNSAGQLLAPRPQCGELPSLGELEECY